MATSSRTSELDAGLVKRAVAGDRAAQEAVLEHYHPFIRATLMQLTFGRIDDLQELQQQTLERVARGLRGFAFDSAPSTWMRGVCANAVKDYLRRKRRRARAEAPGSDEALAGFFEPVATLEARDTLRGLLKAIEELSPSQRTVFVLRLVYGHSIDEVAQMMNATRAATRARLYFARRAIQRRLAEASGGARRPDPSEWDREVKAL